MDIEPGRELLHYRVVDKIGEGGMGVVWKAVDTTLDREVALKVLPANLATDAERLARFEREAKVLASLNHPHVATIHGLHEVDGVRFLTMEYVRGEDLTAAIPEGLTVERVVEIGVEICEALEAAHAQGIVHRDLKPANVMLTPERRAKVLDFGLAKALGPGPMSGDGAGGPTMSPTLTSAGTVAGVVLGTAAYMAPEQARGRDVDRSADLWAFGCLLYEMLSAKRAFDGETISDTIASVLKEEPDWNALPEDTPPGVRRLLRRCLTKDRRKRLGDAGAAALELREAFDPTPPSESGPVPVATGDVTVPTPPPARGAWLPWAIATLAVVAALAGWSIRDAPDQDRAPVALSFAVPEGVRFEDDQMSSLAIAPDGSAVVMTGIDEDGRAALYLRHLDDERVVRMADTEDAENPFFSPDGEWVAFYQGTELRKVSVAGGSSVRIVDEVRASRGAWWGDDDRVVFLRSFESPLYVVGADGGPVTQLTELRDDRDERTHRWPQVVPGHDVVLFTVGTKDSPEYYGDADIDAVHLDTGERKTVYRGASWARYVPTGHLLLGRDGALWAIKFDIDALETTGNPVPVMQDVLGAKVSGVVYADVASNGTLVALRGEDDEIEGELVRRRFDGEPEPIEGIPVAGYSDIALSPDGRRIAVGVVREGAFDIWVHELGREAPVLLTFEGDNTSPRWSPDGRWVYFQSTRDGQGAVYRKPSDGRGSEELVFNFVGETSAPMDLSPDGRTLLLAKWGADEADLYTLELDREGAEPRLFIGEPGDQLGARYSPDGRWVAFTSEVSGGYEIFVVSADGGGDRWQVSHSGGIKPLWSADGTKLYYRVGRRLFVSEIDFPGGTFRAGVPRQVFDDLRRAGLIDNFSVHPDGQTAVYPRFSEHGGPPERISVYLHWLDQVSRLVP